MQAHRVTAQVAEHGILTVMGTPFSEGDAVEVIVLPAAAKDAARPSYPLRGVPVDIIDPFEPVVPPEEWEVLQ